MLSDKDNKTDAGRLDQLRRDSATILLIHNKYLCFWLFLLCSSYLTVLLRDTNLLNKDPLIHF